MVIVVRNLTSACPCIGHRTALDASQVIAESVPREVVASDLVGRLYRAEPGVPIEPALGSPLHVRRGAAA